MSDEAGIPTYERWSGLSEQQMVEAAYEMTGGSLRDLTDEKLAHLFTVATFVTDLSLNEIERRGLLHFRDGVPVVPYCSDHGVQTVLTRD